MPAYTNKLGTNMNLVSSFEEVESEVGSEAIEAARMNFLKFNAGATEDDFRRFVVDQARQSQTGFSAERFSNVIMAMVRATLGTYDNAERSQELALKLNDVINGVLKDTDYTVIDVFSSLLSLAGSTLFAALQEADTEHATTCPDCSKAAADTTGYVRA